jgi:hypothetical protein
MVDTCTVSFTARDTSFALLPGQPVVFRPVEPRLDATGSVLRVRKPVTVVADGAGAASAVLTPGPYVLETQVDGDLVSVPCPVPDQATATIDDCLASATAEAYNALAVAMLAAGLRFYALRTAAHADATLANLAFFTTTDAPGGALSVYQKTGATSVLIGPVFPQAVMLAGLVGAPGLSVSGDADTGLYSPAANQLALVTGGVMRWLASSAALQVEVPLTGTAVTQTTTDATAGRVMRVGAFGLGGGASAGVDTSLANIDTITTPAGFYQTTSSSLGTFPAGESLFGQMIVLRYNNANFTQIWMSALTDTLYTRRYRSTDVPAFSPWRPLYSRHNLIGTVSQAAGVPTGAVIERGNNANGNWTRFADGLQICTTPDTGLSVPNASTALGSLFRSADLNWTFPISFPGGPVVTGSTDGPDTWFSLNGAPGGTTATIRALAAVSKASTVKVYATAVGRWF